jgi:hypothetical protein
LSVNAQTFDFFQSLVWVAALVTAGPLSLGGAVLAAVLLVWVPAVFDSPAVVEWQPIAFGVAAIFFSQARNGLVGFLRLPDFSTLARRHEWRLGSVRFFPAEGGFVADTIADAVVALYADTPPTGADLATRLSTKHPGRDHCPGCGESISTCAITRLAYAFAACDCELADYSHLVERIWHIGCITHAAPDLAARDMLDSAAFVLGRYKRGKEIADRIREFLHTRHDVDSQPKPLLRGYLVGCGPVGDGDLVELTVHGIVVDPDQQVDVGLKDGTRVVVTVAADHG